MSSHLFSEPCSTVPPAANEPRPITVLLPAHDEEATVARVIARMPASALGHPVRCLVVDDGSSDRTAPRAAAAGAEVVSLPTNRGLGAAVRTGLRVAVDGGALVVAFLDADEEYAPEELETLVAPILRDRADYVVGNRFAGSAMRMRWHRRLGNRLLTRVWGVLAPVHIGDGQSGYRALSREAADSAEIIHDYNYAQVLTLDLLSKGFRYREVPISYRSRREGRSFIRLSTYLRRCVPAVMRQVRRGRRRLNTPLSRRPHASRIR
jgi:glycosyltransferase involved in cell wall biosynthesis